jgi:hypothetical protein
MTLPAGLKDWRTTVPGVITGIAAFMALNPDLFDQSAYWVKMTQRIAAFITAGGLTWLGVVTPSSAKVIEKNAKLKAKLEGKIEQQR